MGLAVRKDEVSVDAAAAVRGVCEPGTMSVVPEEWDGASLRAPERDV